jgi:CRP-like cAMP-binding protein
MVNVIQDLKDKITESNVWSQELTIKRNEFLLQAGKVEKYLYFIEEGTLRVFTTREGEEQVIRFGYPGSIISGLDSFLSGRPSIFNLQAIKKCRLKAIHVQSFNDLINSTPENTKLYLVILKQFVLQQIEREEDLLTSSPEDRYQRVLKRSPRLFQEIPSKYIASYLRMTPETLSRLKKS